VSLIMVTEPECTTDAWREKHERDERERRALLEARERGHREAVERTCADDEPRDTARRKLLEALMDDCPACVPEDAYTVPRAELEAWIKSHDQDAEVP
jgi:hypothetical protein